MALKAGYYGVKKSLIDTIRAITSSLLIQDIGDGLEYDEETGELSSDIKSVGDGLVLDENGELSVDGDIGGYKKDLLYGSSTITYPASQSTDYTLAHDIKDYDEIHVISGWTADSVNCVESWVIDAKLLDGMSTASQQKDYQFVFPCNTGGGTGQWLRFSKGNADNVIHAMYDGSVGVYQIYGVKF